MDPLKERVDFQTRYLDVLVGEEVGSKPRSRSFLGSLSLSLSPFLERGGGEKDL